MRLCLLQVLVCGRFSCLLRARRIPALFVTLSLVCFEQKSVCFESRVVLSLVCFELHKKPCTAHKRGLALCLGRETDLKAVCCGFALNLKRRRNWSTYTLIDGAYWRYFGSFRCPAHTRTSTAPLSPTSYLSPFCPRSARASSFPPPSPASATGSCLDAPSPPEATPTSCPRPPPAARRWCTCGGECCSRPHRRRPHGL